MKNSSLALTALLTTIIAFNRPHALAQEDTMDVEIDPAAASYSTNSVVQNIENVRTVSNDISHKSQDLKKNISDFIEKIQSV